MEDEDLAVAVRPRADPDRRDRQLLADAGGDRRGHGLEHEREAPCLLERDRVVQELQRLRGRLALRPEAAEQRRRLRE